MGMWRVRFYLSLLVPHNRHRPPLSSSPQVFPEHCEENERHVEEEFTTADLDASDGISFPEFVMYYQRLQGLYATQISTRKRPLVWQRRKPSGANRSTNRWSRASVASSSSIRSPSPAFVQGVRRLPPRTRAAAAAVASCRASSAEGPSFPTACRNTCACARRNRLRRARRAFVRR